MVSDYLIAVKTGDCLGAETDANVFVCLNGDDGYQAFSLDTPLRQPGKQRQNKFIRDQTDVFNVHGDSNLGPLKTVTVWHDQKGSGSTSAWYLEAIQVLDLSSNKIYHFPCAHWLATRKEDHKVRRTLECKKSKFIHQLEPTAQQALAPFITVARGPPLPELPNFTGQTVECKQPDEKKPIKTGRVIVLEPTNQPSESSESQSTDEEKSTPVTRDRPIVAQTEVLVEGKKKGKKMAKQMGMGGGQMGMGAGQMGMGAGQMGMGAGQMGMGAGQMGRAPMGAGYGGYPAYGGGYAVAPAYGYGYGQPYGYGGYGYGAPVMAMGFKGHSWSWSWS